MPGDGSAAAPHWVGGSTVVTINQLKLNSHDVAGIGVDEIEFLYT